jgi:hypothetical protein
LLLTGGASGRRGEQRYLEGGTPLGPRRLLFDRLQQNATVRFRTERPRMPKKQSRPRRPTIYDFRIELRHIKPAIWRQVLVPSVMHLDSFHGVIQESFGWQDYHLYRFEFRDRAFERKHAESEAEDAGKMRLDALGLSEGDTILYTYDFGDDWEHVVRLVGTRPIDPDASYPVCIDGARAGPLEDCGGPPGYERLLAVLKDPTHPEFLELRRWTGAHFHPEMFDLRATNRILQLAFE